MCLTYFVFMTSPIGTAWSSVKVSFYSNRRVDLVKCGQTGHQMTPDGEILNTRMLELIKIHIPYMDHFTICKSFGKLCSQVLKTRELTWSNEAINDVS